MTFPFTVWDKWRYAAAMKAIESTGADIVLLSEVFTARGKHKFKSKIYPYQADGGNWFPRLVGSGTRILSKFPLTEHAILTYQACKKEDCLSRKGANLVTIELPTGKKLNIVSTHLNAAGGESFRIAQLKQLAIFADYYEDKTAPTLIAGDMNFGPQSSEYQYAMQNLGVTDAWAQTHSASEPGYTYDCYANHYARDYTIKTGGSFFKERIDYFFPRGAIKTISTELTMNNDETLYSDHYGIIGEFEF